MSLKATIAELILNATTAGRALLTAADAAAQKVLLSLSKSDVGLGNVDNTSDASKPVSAATEAALSGKQATLVSGTNIKTVNSTSLLGAGDITISAGIGGSVGSTDNRLVRSDGTGTLTVQSTGITVDDSNNVSSVGTIECGAITSSGVFTLSGNSATSVPIQRLTGTWFTGGTGTTTKPHVLVEPTGATSTAWNTAGTGIGVNAASGFTGDLLSLQTNGVSAFRVTSAGVLIGAQGASGLSCGGINVGFASAPTAVAGGQIIAYQSGVNKVAIVSSQGLNIASDLALRFNSNTANTTLSATLSRNADGVLQVGTTASNALGSLLLTNLTASGLIGLGAYTVATLPSAAANAGQIAQVTDSSVTANGATVAGGGANRVMVFSNGTNWDVVVA